MTLTLSPLGGHMKDKAESLAHKTNVYMGGWGVRGGDARGLDHPGTSAGEGPIET